MPLGADGQFACTTNLRITRRLGGGGIGYFTIKPVSVRRCDKPGARTRGSCIAKSAIPAGPMLRGLKPHFATLLFLHKMGHRPGHERDSGAMGGTPPGLKPGHQQGHGRDTIGSSWGTSRDTTRTGPAAQAPAPRMKRTASRARHDHRTREDRSAPVLAPQFLVCLIFGCSLSCTCWWCSRVAPPMRSSCPEIPAQREAVLERCSRQ